MQGGLEFTPNTLEMLLQGGNIGVLAFVGWVAIKVNTRLVREESLRRNYPPHRHIEDTVIYPDEYPPAKVEHISAS